MFNRSISGVFKAVEHAIKIDNLFATVSVNVTITHDTVIGQYLDITSYLISKDFDHKPWN